MARRRTVQSTQMGLLVAVTAILAAGLIGAQVFAPKGAKVSIERVEANWPPEPFVRPEEPESIEP